MIRHLKGTLTTLASIALRLACLGPRLLIERMLLEVAGSPISTQRVMGALPTKKLNTLRGAMIGHAPLPLKAFRAECLLLYPAITSHTEGELSSRI